MRQELGEGYRKVSKVVAVETNGYRQLVRASPDYLGKDFVVEIYTTEVPKKLTDETLEDIFKYKELQARCYALIFKVKYAYILVIDTRTGSPFTKKIYMSRDLIKRTEEELKQRTWEWIQGLAKKNPVSPWECEKCIWRGGRCKNRGLDVWIRS